jgi:hypothetical protein
MTLTFDFKTVQPVEIPVNPNINIELGTFLSAPQVQISKIIKIYLLVGDM